MLHSALPIYTLACPRAAVYKNSGVAWIVQHAQYMAVLKLAPDHASLAWTRMNASREQYSGVAEIPDRGHCRPSSLKSIEQEADRTLNLLVWIQNRPPRCIIGETDGWPYE